MSHKASAVHGPSVNHTSPAEVRALSQPELSHCPWKQGHNSNLTGWVDMQHMGLKQYHVHKGDMYVKQQKGLKCNYNCVVWSLNHALPEWFHRCNFWSSILIHYFLSSFQQNAASCSIKADNLKWWFPKKVFTFFQDCCWLESSACLRQ